MNKEITKDFLIKCAADPESVWEDIAALRAQKVMEVI